ncbi:MAG: hypothetical protein BGN88_01765 [Clostridiales bacterium 43-6]|nr:MAG: hypothetical protein BGN88_01765 [Clostridiales bacterium 43-6]
MLQLQAIVKLLCEFETLIAYRALNIYELFQYTAENKNYEKLKFLHCYIENYNPELPFPLAFEQALKQAEPQMALKAEDRKQLSQFASVLGTTDVDGQIKNCRLYINLFEKSLSEALKITAQKQKLYYSLGIIAGLFSAVMLI